MNKDLRQYLKIVKAVGPDYYVEVKKRLEPRLEVSVLQEKLEAEGRFPVLYRPEIEGSKLPLVTNLIGNYDRWSVAFGIDRETFNKVGEASIFQEHRRRWHEAFAHTSQSSASDELEKLGWKVWEDEEDLDEDLIQQSLSDCGQSPSETVYVIITEDGDFTDLLEELRERGIRNYLSGPQGSNGDLVNEVGEKRWIPWKGTFGM